ncbi:hypothetical protein [Solimonas soli]|uniref:hypothetical protein n=1 Tax=Solimonas soli TaxID=413479 RepID=UPI000484EB8F|nr:hypothetical protein [Solimonas soli]
MSDKKPGDDDVQQLLRDLQLGNLQYREFTAPTAAKLRLAGGKPQEPAVTLPADPAVVPAKPAPDARLAAGVPPLSAAAPTPALPPAAAPRNAATRATALDTTSPSVTTAVHESPLNFTFERLRRQVIPARAAVPQLNLQLPPRQRVILQPRLARLRQRALAEVFAALAQTPADKRQSS